MRTVMLIAVLAAPAALSIAACDSSDGGGGGDTDSDTDTDSDSDTDTDSDTDSDTDTDDTDTCDLGVYDDGFNVYDTDDIEELKGYTVVTGGLDVGGDVLTDLVGLECLTEVDMLFVECETLTSLAGLDNLATVTSNAEITSNPALEDLTGLGSLTTVGGTLDLASMPLVTDLSGLESLETVSWLRISWMNGLSDLSGFDALTSVGAGGMRILWCDEITGLSGADSLATIEGELAVIGNPQLPFCEICPVLEQLDEPPPSVAASDNLDDECGTGDAGTLDCDEPDGGPDAG